MKDPIRVHAGDSSEDDIRSRHIEIEDCLEKHGPDQVRIMLFSGGLPTNWNPIINAWLAGKKLER